MFPEKEKNDCYKLFQFRICCDGRMHQIYHFMQRLLQELSIPQKFNSLLRKTPAK